MAAKNRDEGDSAEAQKKPDAIGGRQRRQAPVPFRRPGMTPNALHLASPSDETEILLGRHEIEPQHARQVARLALRLFDDLGPVHGCGAGERRLLECAALLHDIGWSVSGRDGRGHHKASARLIREFPWTTLTPVEVRSVAAVARYHRKALPDPEHEDLKGIPPANRARIDWMAACLRTADGLDRRHLQAVGDLSVRFGERRIELRVSAVGRIDEELAAADKKSDLLRRLLDRPIDFVQETPPPGRPGPGR